MLCWIHFLGCQSYWSLLFFKRTLGDAHCHECDWWAASGFFATVDLSVPCSITTHCPTWGALLYLASHCPHWEQFCLSQSIILVVLYVCMYVYMMYICIYLLCWNWTHSGLPSLHITFRIVSYMQVAHSFMEQRFWVKPFFSSQLWWGELGNRCLGSLCHSFWLIDM